MNNEKVQCHERSDKNVIKFASKFYNGYYQTVETRSDRSLNAIDTPNKYSACTTDCQSYRLITRSN